MYLATLAISFALEEEVAPAHRERVMRTLVAKLRQHLGNRASVRADHDATVFVSFFDEAFEPLKQRAEALSATLDDWSILRVSGTDLQLFRFYENRFVECAGSSDSLPDAEFPSVTTPLKPHPDHGDTHSLRPSIGRQSPIPVANRGGSRLPARK